MKTTIAAMFAALAISSPALAGCIGQGCGEPGDAGDPSEPLTQYQVMNWEGITYSPALGARSYGLEVTSGATPGAACVIDGMSDGPLIRSTALTAAVYECDGEAGDGCASNYSHHCGTGGSCQACPSNCSTAGYEGYHSTEAYQFDRDGQTSFLGVEGQDWGDGISQTLAAAGTEDVADSSTMNVYGTSWDNIHDDLFECDWGCDMNIDQTFADSVKMVVAQHCRGSGDPDECPMDFSSYTVKLSNSFFHIVGRQDPNTGLPLFGFKNGYKQKIGSGGMFKFMKAQQHGGSCPSGTPSCNPAVQMTNLIIYAGPKLIDDDQLLFPPLDSIESYDANGTPTDFSDDTVSPTDCQNVKLYWNGTDDELDTALSKVNEYGDDYFDDSTWNESLDGADRRNVLDNVRTGDYPGSTPCLSVVVRCSGSSCSGDPVEADFWAAARNQPLADWESWGF